MKVKNFNLAQTLECGQCFNFERLSDGSFVVIAFNRAVHVRQIKDEIIFENANEEEVEKIWIPYFDLDNDYAKIKRNIIKADNNLRPIIEEYYGIHILKQDFVETLISFIISQNKNITNIKQIVRRICETYGKKAGVVDGKTYYAFPSLKALNGLSEADFRDLKVGFRAPYLKDAVDKLVSKEIVGSKLSGMSYEEAKAKLISIKGVGDKVANCVLLFGLGFTNAFPVDVWIKRIMEDLYFHKDTDKDVIEAFGKDKFGEYGGFAQQYLFIYAQNNSKKVLQNSK